MLSSEVKISEFFLSSSWYFFVTMTVRFRASTPSMCALCKQCNCNCNGMKVELLYGAMALVNSFCDWWFVTLRYYSRRSSDSARSSRDLPSERANRDVYATTPCVVKDAIPPPYELHFQTSPTAGWHGPGRHGRRRPPDAEHDYESMDEEADPRYPGGGLTNAGSCGYQTVGIETALRPGGNGYAATVVSAPTSVHVTRHCSYQPTTFNW